jgi:hypothetical protein
VRVREPRKEASLRMIFHSSSQKTNSSKTSRFSPFVPETIRRRQNKENRVKVRGRKQDEVGDKRKQAVGYFEAHLLRVVI